MLKHQDIINSLTIEQKLKLIADVSALKGEKVGEIDYKFLHISSLSDALKNRNYPSFKALANSWNYKLIRQVTEDTYRLAKKDGVTLIDLPYAGVKQSPYSAGLSVTMHLQPMLMALVHLSKATCFITSGIYSAMIS